jgi:hypothetical protein
MRATPRCLAAIIEELILVTTGNAGSAGTPKNAACARNTNWG